jgi:hypothetical protein
MLDCSFEMFPSELSTHACQHKRIDFHSEEKSTNSLFFRFEKSLKKNLDKS